MKKFALYTFLALMVVSLLTPFLLFSHLLFPYITSKAFFFRIVIEAALPFYLFLAVSDAKLRPNLKNPLNLFVLGFFVVNIVSALFGVNVSRSLWGNFERMGGVLYLAHLVAFYFYVLLLGQANSRFVKFFLQSFIVASLGVTVNGIIGWLGGPTLTLDPSLPVRVSSTFGNPIFFASFLVLPMFLSIYLALQEQRGGWKIAYLVSAVLMLVGIYSSGTRGAVLGLVVGVFLAAIPYVFLTQHKNAKRYGTVVIVAIVLVMGSLYAIHNKLPQGSTLSRIANLKDSNTEARLIQWKMALTGYKDHWFLGTGSENYYVVSDKYYNPELYNYDASWFDKPHNFLLEVLVTNGLLGFICYLAMAVFALYGLWRAYKTELLGLGEMVVLIGALLSYQFQNLFVFDTVSASIAFYGFLGFVAYMWYESEQSPELVKKDVKRPHNGLLAGAVFVTSLLAMLYVEYAANMSSLFVAKRVNFGYLYTQQYTSGEGQPTDMKKASEFFSSALTVPFNLDKKETANRYSQFAQLLVQSDLATSDPTFVSSQLQIARQNQKTLTEKVGNDPVMWMTLQGDDVMYGLATKEVLDASDEASIRRALALAPNRAELWQVLLETKSYEKDWPGLVEAAEKIVSLKKNDTGKQWQLALAYELAGRHEDAVREGDIAIAGGYQFKNLREAAWYIQEYQKRNDPRKLAALLEQAVNLEPQDVSLVVELAKAYAAAGNKDGARMLAEQVSLRDPSQKAAMDAFINTLK